MQKNIVIKGARVNNLKNVDLEFPLNKMTCFLGPSGSGKTSLAFQTIHSESKRRFLNSFPTYLKFFSDRPAPVDVDEIYPVLPVFGLPQINPVVGTRSNVADVMHLTELLQSHFFNYSEELCPEHKVPFKAREFSDILKSYVEDDSNHHLFIKAQDFLDLFVNLPLPTRSLKSTRAKTITEFEKEHDFWEVARFKPQSIERINDKVKDYIAKGVDVYVFSTELKKLKHVTFKKGLRACSVDGCGHSAIENKTPLYFSPYNALGACNNCSGFGETLDYDQDKLVDLEKSVSEDGVLLLNYKRYLPQKAEFKKVLKKNKISLTEPIKNLPQIFWDLLYIGEGNYYGFNYYFSYLERKKYKMNVRIFIRNLQKSIPCNVCSGSRLSTETNQFFLGQNHNITLKSLFDNTIDNIQKKLGEIKYTDKNAKKAFDKILGLLKIASSIGLGHLSLDRKAKTLSAGEYQRLLLLKYLTYDGTGALFIFDEPSLGLSSIELKYLNKAFQHLISRGNTIVLVEHNKFLAEQSDHIIQMGPEAGYHGGEVLYQGTSDKFKWPQVKFKLEKTKLSKPQKIKIKKPSIYGRNIQDIEIVKAGINWIHGPSGSGKTGAIVNTLAAHIHYNIYGEHLNMTRGKFDSITGVLDFEDVIIVDANLNRYTSRSTVGSMTGLFPVVRKHFANLAISKSMGLVEGNFSYNSALGACPKCEGKGVNVVEMQFLEDIVLTCEDCEGKKLKPIYANISDGEMTVHESFSNPLHKVLESIKLTPKFQRVEKYLNLLNLDYLSLNRQINSLSGGEKQRIYLLSKLQKKLENSLLIFENISFGLSEKELFAQAKLMQKLTEDGNTIIIIDQSEIFEKIAHLITKIQ